MKTRQLQTDAFKVKTKSGKIYDISEVQTQTYHEFLNPADNNWAEGMTEYKVKGGGHANKKSSNEYEIVATEEIAVRID